MSRATRPDVEKVLRGLKDFQRASVEYAFERLYGDDDPVHRFLIADEVGLGKTLVARGLIAKTIDHLWDETKRIDIVYICSSLDIAAQNIRRLHVGDFEAALPTRLTLLPRQVKDLRKNKVNFVSLTPNTSFDLKTSLGRAEERALLFWLLKRAWGIRRTRGNLRVLQGNRDPRWFEHDVDAARQRFNIDREIADEFARRLRELDADNVEAEEPTIRSRFAKLAAEFGRLRGSRGPDQSLRNERARLVSELRQTLAESCLEALEPDLIILDEFQRFKDLLHADDDAGLLAQRLFNFQQHDERPRVVLLSATPYKMYTLAEESAEDDHYADFLNTMSFLAGEQDTSGAVASALDTYRRALYRIPDLGLEPVIEARDELRALLHRSILRTERLASTADRDGMLRERHASDLRLDVGEVLSYRGLRKVATVVDQPDPIEFWKSAPYLLNFMDRYRFNGAFLDGVESDLEADLAAALKQAPGSVLRWRDVRAYRRVDPNNARLRSLVAETLDRDLWRLLWMPPTLPYHQLGGPFAGLGGDGGPTKRLIFSSWVVVPKVIACLASYEAERRMMNSPKGAVPKNTVEARASRGARLQFTSSAGRLTGMPVLAMLYPSPTLARLGDPLEFARRSRGGEATIEALLADVESRLGPKLDAIVGHTRSRRGAEDESWYWAAPLLLDARHDRAKTREWWERPDLAAIWQGDDVDEVARGLKQHLAEAGKVVFGQVEPKGRPPKDLLQVLAKLAVAAPGNVCLRALGRVTPASSAPWLRDAAVGAAGGFRSLFNLPETMAMLDGLDAREPYWMRVIEYCLNGDIQAVMDEYVHISLEALGLVDQDAETTGKVLSETIRGVLTLRTPSLGVREVAPTRSGGIRTKPQRMRTSFALRFRDGSDTDGETASRPEQVRQAFNSPFWPFVLATTSVGQEGLDFHQYAHTVVHWNLPSNPVDLEQREGRVHRYKGHAVRKNLAERYAAVAWTNGARDPWAAMFSAASADRALDGSDVVPYWVLEGSSKIERVVPALPLSRESERLGALRKSLAMYRMVFGQPRQDDLLSYLMTRLPDDQLTEALAVLRIDLSAPAR
jgi:hypothetical protein